MSTLTAMKILLVGATGQVGYALAHALHAAGHDLTVLVRRDRLPFPDGVRVEVAPEFTADVFAEALGGIDCAVYGVGLPEQFAFDTRVFEQVNYGLLTRFLAAVEESPLRRLVYISTYEVFDHRGGIIREKYPLNDPAGLTPYFRAMYHAYAETVAFAERTGTRLTTIHPAALYGGLDTGYGFTSVIENLIHRRFWRLPVVPRGRFPLIHADSLAEGIVASLDHDGAFILSDTMCDLPTLAREVRRQTESLVPPTVPAPLAYGAIWPLEQVGKLVRVRPILAKVQLDFITAGLEPRPERAIAELDWYPMLLAEGLKRYLADRDHLLGLRAG